MIDFDRYFLKDCQIFLSHVDYDFLSPPVQGENKLLIKDSVSSYDLDDDKVKIEIARSLDFGTGKLFSLTVVFGVMLTKNPFSKNEINWSTINVADEFKHSKIPLLGNITSRISLLIAEITSSYGQVPIVTPPQLIK